MGPQPGAGDVGLAAPAVERTLVAVKPRGRKTRMLTTISFFFCLFFTADTDCGIHHSLEHEYGCLICYQQSINYLTTVKKIGIEDEIVVTPDMQFEMDVLGESAAA